jgi:hypothetical protein
MTTSKVTTKRNGAKQSAENPQIRRAAERLSGNSNGHAEPSEGVPPPLPRLPGHSETEFQRRTRIERAERHATALSRLVTGGLYVSDDPGSGCESEVAIIRAAGAVAKATMLSLGSYTDHHVALDGAQDTMTNDDTIAALSVVVTLLQSGPRALNALREAGTFRDSLTRWETREERGETEEVFAAASEAAS